MSRKIQVLTSYDRDTKPDGIAIIIPEEHVVAFKRALHSGMNTYEGAPVELRSLDDILQHGTDLETLKHNPHNDKSTSTQVGNYSVSGTDTGKYTAE